MGVTNGGYKVGVVPLYYYSYYYYCYYYYITTTTTVETQSLAVINSPSLEHYIIRLKSKSEMAVIVATTTDKRPKNGTIPLLMLHNFGSST